MSRAGLKPCATFDSSPLRSLQATSESSRLRSLQACSSVVAQPFRAARHTRAKALRYVRLESIAQPSGPLVGRRAALEGCSCHTRARALRYVRLESIAQPSGPLVGRRAALEGCSCHEQG